MHFAVQRLFLRIVSAVAIALLLTHLAAVRPLMAQPEEAAGTRASSAVSCPPGMTWIPGGTFRMGADDRYREEQSAEDVTVQGFCIDQYEVTNAQFAQFIDQTSYVTVAERPLSVEEFPDLAEADRVPGSLVFQTVPPEQYPVQQLAWWHWVPGANWHHPQGPDSGLAGRENHPVVHIAYEDAVAYAQWANKALPTEAEWEFAARGGLPKALYVWGNQYAAQKANTWQGLFPWVNTQKDGYEGTAPVGSYAANGYGLYDMAGNVWEWVQDWYRYGHDGKAHKVNPIVDDKADALDLQEPGVAKHVVKGGSYLCAPNYCSRYRPAARQGQEPNTGTSHIGFRLVTHPA